MNPFSQLHTDVVYIVDSSGHRSGPYKTRIGSKGGYSASIFEKELDVYEGYELVRELPSNREEHYTILDCNYSEGLSSIPPHWTLKLEKKSSIKKERQSHTSTTYNISNSQGFQIGDHNLQHIEASITGLIEKIEDADASKAEKDEAKSKIRQMLENPTVAALLGSSTAALLGMI